MTDEFTLYDIWATCRACGQDFQKKSFLPAADGPSFGLCDACREADDALMRALTDPHPRDANRKPEVPDYRQRAAGDT